MPAFADLTRRKFVQLAGILFGGLAVPAAVEAGVRKRGAVMYRWSGRGRRVSRAALAHAANRRYASRTAALRDLPHPGANLKLVRANVSRSDFARFFLNPRRSVIDLRHF